MAILIIAMSIFYFNFPVGRSGKTTTTNILIVGDLNEK